jgi:hypothetical protein
MMSIVVVVLKELSKTMCTNVQRKNRGWLRDSRTVGYIQYR